MFFVPYAFPFSFFIPLTPKAIQITRHCFSKLAKQIIIIKKGMKWLPRDFLLHIPASFQYIVLIITFIHAMLFHAH